MGDAPKILYVADGMVREYAGEPSRSKGRITWTAAPEGSMLAKLWARAIGGADEPRFTPDETRAAIDEYETFDPLCGEGPAHVALGDGNLEIDSLAFCIRECLEEYARTDEADHLRSAHFMACLQGLDDAERCWPERQCPCEDCEGCQCRWAGIKDGCEGKEPCSCPRDADGFRD